MSSFVVTQKGDVVLVLSRLEAKGLLACAEGLMIDPASAKSYIGNRCAIDAADEALTTLRRACVKTGRCVVSTAALVASLREIIDLCALGDTDETTEVYGWGEAIKRAKLAIAEAEGQS